MKRVLCLYRVSTLGQVEKDDIPMQKQSCHEFVAKNEDWKIVGEYSEKGVSGFKVSAKDRDAIQELQKAAIEGKFDILLVFMFDRIGRKEDETPFVVEWFVQHGIEVWSVHEGQQRFDNHVDKLLNYIRYWQASGESVKTSIRTKTRMGQIVQEGHFRGGVAPFGYRLERLGRTNKKGQEVYDLVVDEAEAAIVRLIFDRHCNAGMGPQTISAFLTQEKILNRSGECFVSPTIRNMVKNPMYRGVMRSGECTSEPFEHLCIIDDVTFFRSQELILQRSENYQEHRRIPKKTTENCLLTGNIFCGHCGARLITSTGGKKYVRKDGSINDRRTWRYLCYNKVRHKGKCCGRTSYSAARLDEAIAGIVRGLLADLKDVPLSSIGDKRLDTEIKAINTKLSLAERELSKKTDDLGALKAEVVRSIRGESSFTPDLLSATIVEAECERDEAEQTIQALSEALKDAKGMFDSFKEQHGRYISFAEMFDVCDESVKKMIICELIDRIDVREGYNIDIALTVTMEQYQALRNNAENVGEKSA
ncbi:MAG: recombinase family protein [Coriobacteriales bacterium]|jgi:DNA invertase Pin-like site-specific DNA recombinase|nr:recombinase family protein [Coriobacteriales bacterium]